MAAFRIMPLTRNEPIGRELYSVIRTRIMTGSLRPGDAFPRFRSPRRWASVARRYVRCLDGLRMKVSCGFFRRSGPLCHRSSYRPSTIVNSFERLWNAERSALHLSAKRGWMPTVLATSWPCRRVLSVTGI